MDVTTTSPQTHRWELLAQLALCGQKYTSTLEVPHLVRQLANLMQSHLPHSWGVLVETTNGHATAWESWGLSTDEAHELMQSNGRIDTSHGLLYPLRAGDEEFGLLLLAPLNRSASEDETFYEAVAAQLGLILQAQHRYRAEQQPYVEQQRTDEMQLLDRIHHMLTSTTDPEHLLHQVYDCLTQFFPIDTCNILLYQAEYDEITGSLHVQADGSRFVTTTPQAPEFDSSTAQVFQTQQPLLIPESAGSWMGVPLLTHMGRFVGAVVVQCRAPDCYGDRELALLNTVASHLALIVQNVQLVTQAENQVLQLRVLNEISQVAASTHDMTVVYRAVVSSMVEVTGVDQARLLLRDRDTNVGYIVAEHIPTHAIGDTAIPLEGLGVVAWLEEHLSPFIAYDAQHEPLFSVEILTHLRELDIHSMAIVPLILNDEVVGGIGLDFVGRQMHFSWQQLLFCQTIANHITTVIDKDRLFVQAQSNAYALQSKVSELSTLLESAGILGSLLQPDEVLKSLTDLVSRQLRVTSVALWTIEEDEMLTPRALYGLEMSNLKDLGLPVGSGITGRVAATGLPLRIDDIDEGGGDHFPHFFGHDDRLTSYMGVPIFYRDKVIGVLSVMTAERREFSSDEMMLLIGLASQAAIALENARLFQERERRIAELTTINQISTAVNAILELNELLLVLHKDISKILDTSCSVIGLYEEIRLDVAESLLRLRVVRNGDEAQLSDDTLTIDGKGLIDYVVLTCTPLLLQTVDDVRNHVHTWRIYPDDWEMDTARLSALNIPFACWLGVPIMLGDDMLGVINLQSTRPFAYTQDDLQFLSTVASQAAVAITNARMFTERERRLRELSVLKDIGGAISSMLDVQTVLQHLRYELSQAIDMSTSMIGQYDERTNTLSYDLCYDRGERVYIDPIKVNDHYFGANTWVIRNRQPLLLHTVEQGRQIGFPDFGFSMFEVRSAQSRLRTRATRASQSFLVVPIISGDSVLGVINIQSYNPYAFDQDDLRFVMTVANQAAVTIANVHLFMERERRIKELETFNEIGRALSTTVKMDELPELVYRQTSLLLDTSNFSMALVDDERKEVTVPLVYYRGSSYSILPPNKRDCLYAGEYRFPVAPEAIRHWAMITRLTERVISRGEPILVYGSDTDRGGWITDISELREEFGYTVQYRSPHLWLGAPMMVGGKVAGVIALQNYQSENAFNMDDVRLLSTIASAAAIALANARLFEQISNLAADLEQRVAARTNELAEANVQLLEEKERLETVHAITLELTASLDLDEIISRALEIASTNLNVEHGSIMMRDPQTGSLICRAILYGQGVVQRANLPISFAKGQGLANWVIEHQEPVCIADVRDDKRWVIEAGRAENARSVVCVPLMTSDSTLGVLILLSPEINYFTAAQLRLLSTVANEVAIAINNAQLYSYITEMATRLADLLEQQKEETSKSRSILQSMTEGVIVLDNEQRIAMMNMAAEHMLNIPANNVLEQPLTRLSIQGQTVEERQRAETIYNALYEGLETAKERQSIFRTSFELAYPNQTIAVNLSTVTGLDGGIYGDVAVLRDITAEIEADRAKRQFVSGVSHELRTPLTAIKGHVDLLLMGVIGTMNEQQIESLTTAKTNVKRLQELTEDILDISRFEAGKIGLNFAQVDIGVVIKDVVQSLRLEAERKEMQVTVDVAEELPPVAADKKRITQVFLNLFSNAVKYTYSGGKVMVRAFLNPANLLQVEVEDTGVGIPPHEQKKLFVPFFRADTPLRDEVGGTGLGLLITKTIVEEHGGQIWFVSEFGKGSTFSFVLPLEQAEPEETTSKDNE